MITIYVYVLDTLADYRLGPVTSELNWAIFQKDAAPSTQNCESFQRSGSNNGRMTILPDLD